MTVVTCPILMIASPSSNQGKTVFTAALARAHSKQGRKVAVFKMGPDYLDPMIHQVASQQTVYNLDLWMMGEQHCRELLYKAATENDIILIESLMGLHDSQPSSAEFAQRFDIPILLLLNVAKYAQTAAAIVHGLQFYRKPSASQDNPPLNIFAVVGNRVGSENHHLILKEVLGDVYLGSFKRDDALQLPERHLGLLQAAEIKDLDKMLDYAANKLLNDTTADKKLLNLPTSVRLDQIDSKSDSNVIPCQAKPNNHFHMKTIAIAKDAAFSFIYAANIDYLVKNGAKILYFSPLNNDAVPNADMLWLPGGYPELYLSYLEANETTKSSIREFCEQNKPVLAECGGFLYLQDSITDKNNVTASMCGVFKGTAELKSCFQGIGLQTVTLNSEEYRGHSFHHSVVQTAIKATCSATKQDSSLGEAVYKVDNITASYLHFYFPFNPRFYW